MLDRAKLGVAVFAAGLLTGCSSTNTATTRFTHDGATFKGHCPNDSPMYDLEPQGSTATRAWSHCGGSDRGASYSVVVTVDAGEGTEADLEWRTGDGGTQVICSAVSSDVLLSGSLDDLDGVGDAPVCAYTLGEGDDPPPVVLEWSMRFEG